MLPLLPLMVPMTSRGEQLHSALWCLQYLSFLLPFLDMLLLGGPLCLLASMFKVIEVYENHLHMGTVADINWIKLTLEQ